MPKLWYETFGVPSDPPVLLIMGAGSQGILWTNAFCEKLASHHFFVIRYDHRDTGLSTCFDFETSPYNLMDLTDDALALLSSLKIDKAHVVGLSMGGYIAQLIEIHHPERLLSATLMMTTPNHMVFMNALAGSDVSGASLPAPASDVVHSLMTPPTQFDRDSVIHHAVQSWKLANGDKLPFDKEYWNDLVAKHYDRTVDHRTQFNHASACIASAEDRTELLKQVHVPTLVIHGSNDPMLPIEHGKALANAISNSKLVIIEGMGHALNPVVFDEIITLIVRHIS